MWVRSFAALGELLMPLYPRSFPAAFLRRYVYVLSPESRPSRISNLSARSFRSFKHRVPEGLAVTNIDSRSVLDGSTCLSATSYRWLDVCPLTPGRGKPVSRQAGRLLYLNNSGLERRAGARHFRMEWSGGRFFLPERPGGIDKPNNAPGPSPAAPEGTDFG